LILFPVITTPLIADDFGALFTRTNLHDQAKSWNAQYKLALNSLQSNGHFNILGQFASKVLLKAWIQISEKYELPLAYGFWTLKTIVYVFLIVTLLQLLKEIDYGAITDRFEIVTCGLGIFAVNHALWSNDPIVSFPVAGIFSSTIGLISIVYFLKLTKNISLRNSILFLLFSISAPLFYEINMSIYIFFVMYFCIIRGERNKLKLMFFTLSAFLSTFVIILLVRISNPGSFNTYAGTQVDLNSYTSFVRTLVYSCSSILPFKAWLTNSNLSISNVVFCLLLFIMFFIFYILRKVQMLPSISSSCILSKIQTSILFFTWGLSAIGIQAGTKKLQTEATDWSYVYLFYSTIMISAIAILYVNRVSLYRKNYGYLFIAFVITLNVLTNFNSRAKLFDIYSTNHIISSSILKGNVNNFDRCVMKHEWMSSRDWPKYYLDDALKSFDEYSLRVRSQIFCDLSSLNRAQLMILDVREMETQPLK
jgi:hypothetical protein